MNTDQTGPECDDAAYRIVGGHTDGDAITWNNFDTEPPHAAAQLGEHLVPGIALNAIQTPAVHRYDRSLHVD